MPNVLFITRGCAKNEVDTDRMRALLLGAGYDDTSDPDKADVALINTCAFLVSATQESRAFGAGAGRGPKSPNRYVRLRTLPLRCSAR